MGRERYGSRDNRPLDKQLHRTGFAFPRRISDRRLDLHRRGGGVHNRGLRRRTGHAGLLRPEHPRHVLDMAFRALGACSKHRLPDAEHDFCLRR